MIYAKQQYSITQPLPEFPKDLEETAHTVMSDVSPSYSEDFFKLLSLHLNEYGQIYPWFNSLKNVVDTGYAHCAINLKSLVKVANKFILPNNMSYGNSVTYDFYLTSGFSTKALYEVVYFPKTCRGVSLVFPGQKMKKSYSVKENGMIIYPSSHEYSPLLALNGDTDEWLEFIYAQIQVKELVTKEKPPEELLETIP